MTPQARGRAIVGSSFLIAVVLTIGLAGVTRAATLGAACGQVTSSNITVTSTTFADLDTTNLKHTVTTNGGRVLVVFSGTASAQNSDGLAFDVAVDGTRMGTGATFGMTYTYNNTNGLDVSFSTVTAALSAGSHSIALQGRSINGGTMTLYGGASNQPIARFCVHELPTDASTAGGGGGDMSLVAFEAGALDLVEQALFVAGLGFVIVTMLLAGILIATGLRR